MSKELAADLSEHYEYDERVQLSILSLLFRDSRFLVEANQIIRPEYFEKAAYKDVCRWGYEFYEKYKKLPAFETFTNYVEEKLRRLRRKSTTEKDAIRQTLEDSFQIETPNVEYVKDCAVKFARRMAFVDKMNEALEMVEDDRVDEAIDNIQSVRRISLDTSPAIDYFRKTAALDEKESWERFKCGISGLDWISGGIKRKQYGIVCMVTGTGKTTTLLNMARSYARQKKNILVVANEQEESDLQALLDCSILGMSQNTRYKANKSKSKIRQIRKRVMRYQKLWGGNIYLKYKPFKEGRIADIATHVEKLESTEGVKIDGLIVDSLDGMTSGLTDNQWDDEYAVFKEFERYIGEYNKWGWSAVQVDIKGQGNSEESRHITRLGQLRGRADKVFLASLVMALNVTTAPEYKHGKFTKAKGFGIGLKTRNTYVGIRVPFQLDTNIVKLECKKPV